MSRTPGWFGLDRGRRGTFMLGAVKAAVHGAEGKHEQRNDQEHPL